MRSPPFLSSPAHPFPANLRLSQDRDPHLQILADLAGRNTRSSSTELSQVARHWSWLDLSEVVERRFLFRDTALELFFGDGQSYLLTFSHDQKAAALEEIKNKNGASVSSGSLEVVPGTFGAKLSDALVGQRTKLEQATRRWTQRQISNFEYLSILNNVSGRTTNDISNYPVFPWVLSDYTSETLDLEDEGSYRDLSKPMGAQNEKRKRAFAPFPPSFPDELTSLFRRRVRGTLRSAGGTR